jgi:hypothetical protein
VVMSMKFLIQNHRCVHVVKIKFGTSTEEDMDKEMRATTD